MPGRRSFLVACASTGAGCPAFGETGSPTRSPTPSPEPVEGSWPAFGHDAHNTFHNPDATPPRTGPRARWRTDLGGHSNGSPAVAGGTAFVGAGRYFHAVDAATGEHRWQFDAGGAVRSAPTVTDAAAYVASEVGRVYALPLDGGIPYWQYHFGDEGIVAPTLVGGTVVSGGQGVAPTGLDARTGERRWQVDASLGPEGPAAVGGERVLVATYSRLDAVAPGDGRPGWSVDLREVQGYGRSYALGPTVHGDAVFTVLGSSNVGRPALVEVRDLETGELRSDASHEGRPLGHAAVADGSVVVPWREGGLLAFDATSGERRWQEGVPVTGAPPAVADGVAVVGTVSGVAAVAVDTGERLWELDLGDAVRGAPALVGDRVFLTTDAGDLVSLAG